MPAAYLEQAITTMKDEVVAGLAKVGLALKAPRFSSTTSQGSEPPEGSDSQEEEVQEVELGGGRGRFNTLNEEGSEDGSEEEEEEDTFAEDPVSRALPVFSDASPCTTRYVVRV